MRHLEKAGMPELFDMIATEQDAEDPEQQTEIEDRHDPHEVVVLGRRVDHQDAMDVVLADELRKLWDRRVGGC